MPAAMEFAMSAKTLLTSLFQYKANVDEELLDALDSFSDRGPSEELLSAFRVLNHAHIVDRYLGRVRALGSVPRDQFFPTSTRSLVALPLTSSAQNLRCLAVTPAMLI